MLRWLTAGESHGRYLTGVLDGMPAGVPIDIEEIKRKLKRRRSGYGRSSRMEIEEDRINISSGVYGSMTTGSPITVVIENSEWDKYKSLMDYEKPRNIKDIISIPRPGHADLAGILKYRLEDIRDVAERASGRETAVRTALGAIAAKFLEELGIRIASHVLSIGKIRISRSYPVPWEEVASLESSVPIPCIEQDTAKAMMAEIDFARDAGDTLGGSLEVLIKDVPSGLGDYDQPEKRLDSRLAAAALSIPSVKGFAVGSGIQASEKFGSEVHDPIIPSPGKRIVRSSNNAGGIEGGISNGEIIRFTIYFKPVPTLRNPLNSIDLKTFTTVEAPQNRADICIVPSAGVIAESVSALIIADALLEKFGGDSLEEIRERFPQR